MKGSSTSAMEKYENLGLVGEGSYGMVIKCRHKETGQIVAIKKFLESEDDKNVKKIAMREIKMLKQLRHENLVNLIEVFRRKKRLYLVFEFVDRTVLDDLEKYPHGLEDEYVRKVLWQVLRGIQFCHANNIIHRDIKPENILVSKQGIVKLCDFGFARIIAQPGEAYTDYVATRWYRAPELLVGDPKYGKPVDVWAVGCLIGEMLTGDPLFPGDSDIDQLYHIVKCFGHLTRRLQDIFHRNPLFSGMKLPSVRSPEPLEKKYPKCSRDTLNFMKECLRLEAGERPKAEECLQLDYFTANGFVQRVSDELRHKLSHHYRSAKLSAKGATDDLEAKRKKRERKDVMETAGQEEQMPPIGYQQNPALLKHSEKSQKWVGFKKHSPNAHPAAHHDAHQTTTTTLTRHHHEPTTHHHQHHHDSILLPDVRRGIDQGSSTKHKTKKSFFPQIEPTTHNGPDGNLPSL